MKFQAGDSFEVKENSLKGTIKGICFNSILQCTDYVVQWEGRQTEETYPVDECDPIWELTSRNIFIKVPQALDFIPITIDTSGPITVNCNGHHTWVEVGFHFTKMVCKYCDVEQGKV